MNDGTIRPLTMEEKLALWKKHGFTPAKDRWLEGDLAAPFVIPWEALDQVAQIVGVSGGLGWMDFLTGLPFLTIDIGRKKNEAILDRARASLRELGIAFVEGKRSPAGENIHGRLRPIPADEMVRSVVSVDVEEYPWEVSGKPSSMSHAAFRWIEYPGYETTLHIVDGAGRIVGGVSGREHPADGIPKWCAWLNPSRHIGYYVGKAQAKVAVEQAAQEK